MFFKMSIGYDWFLFIEETISKWQTPLVRVIGHFARQIINHRNHLIKWILRHFLHCCEAPPTPLA